MKRLVYLFVFSVFVFAACASSSTSKEISSNISNVPAWNYEQQKIVSEVENTIEGASVTDLWESGRPPNYAENGDKTWCVKLKNRIDVPIGIQSKNTNRLIVYYTTNSQNIFKPIQIYPGDQKGWDSWECDKVDTEDLSS